jgi:hypothetical protein
MIASPVHTAPVAENEAALKAAPLQNAPKHTPLPQDKVTLSAEAQAHIQQPVSSGKDADGDNK